MMRILLTTLLVIGVAVSASGKVVDGLAMMKIEPGARPSGMGGAFVSVGGDPFASAYNPATAAGANQFKVSFGHIEYWENVRLETGYFASPLSGRWSVHGGIRYASLGDIEVRTLPSAQPEAYAEANDISFKGGFAYRISDKLSVGIGAGWFIEKVDAWRGSAFNVDLGVLAAPKPNLSIGASVTNLGGDVALEKTGDRSSRDISLPVTYRAGASYAYRRYLGSADIVVVDDEAHPHLGAEARVHQALAVRAGYMGNYDSKNITAGASFTHRNLTIDYAFVPYTNDLGTTHLFNFTLGL